MICSFCKNDIPDYVPFNFCPTCGQTVSAQSDAVKPVLPVRPDVASRL